MSRIVWRQFGVALFAVVMFALLLRLQSHLGSSRWADSHGGILALLMIEWPQWVANALPLSAGVAMALLPIRAGAFRVASTMLVVVLALLLTWDVFGAPWTNREQVESYIPAPGERGPVLRLGDTAGVVQRGIAHLRGVVRPEDLTVWPPPPSRDSTMFVPISDPAKHIRRDLVDVVIGFGEFLTPFYLMGIVMGFGLWIRRIATFHRERDERMLRLVVGWGTAIGLPMFLGLLGHSSRFEVAMRGQWLGSVILPSVLAMVPAFLGWRAIWRLDRLGAE